jgi:hypothetical protein
MHVCPLTFFFAFKQILGIKIIIPILILNEFHIFFSDHVLGNVTWSCCDYCNKRVAGSYSKVKAHLFKIPYRGVESRKAIGDDKLQVLNQEHPRAERKKDPGSTRCKKQRRICIASCWLDLLQHERRKI